MVGPVGPVSLDLTTDLRPLLILLWLLSEFYIRAYARSKGAPRAVGGTRDRRSGPAILVAVFALFVAVIAYPWIPFWGFLPAWVAVLGEAMMLTGIALRVWAIQVLGRFFTTRVTIQGGHRLIETGPYRYVRHPSYSGALLTLFGFPLAFASPFGLLVALIAIPPTFVYRMRVEEQALLAGLGQSYRAYMSRTTRLVPKIY